MDKDNGGGLFVGGGWVGPGRVMGEKWGQLYLNNKKVKKGKGKNAR